MWLTRVGVCSALEYRPHLLFTIVYSCGHSGWCRLLTLSEGKSRGLQLEIVDYGPRFVAVLAIVAGEHRSNWVMAVLVALLWPFGSPDMTIGRKLRWRGRCWK